jgi:hypothetical protein
MATHHIVAALLPSWGHTISYLHTAKQLLSLDPGLGITIVQHNLVGATFTHASIPIVLNIFVFSAQDND